MKKGQTVYTFLNNDVVKGIYLGRYEKYPDLNMIEIKDTNFISLRNKNETFKTELSAYKYATK